MNAIMSGGDFMTDKQFDFIVEMVLQILERAEDLEDAKKALRAIKGDRASKEE